MTTAVLKPRAAKEAMSIGIDGKSRQKISDALVEVLASTYTLLVKTHVYHWNVVGPLFLPLHQLLEEHYRNMFQAVDDLAERIRSLGVPAPLSFQDFEEASSIKEETQDRSAEGMVRQLVADHETLARRMRDIAGMAEKADDLVTVDMLTVRLAFHEKAIWMLKAMMSN